MRPVRAFVRNSASAASFRCTSVTTSGCSARDRRVPPPAEQEGMRPGVSVFENAPYRGPRRLQPFHDDERSAHTFEGRTHARQAIVERGQRGTLEQLVPVRLQIPVPSQPAGGPELARRCDLDIRDHRGTRREHAQGEQGGDTSGHRKPPRPRRYVRRALAQQAAGEPPVKSVNGCPAPVGGALGRFPFPWRT